MLGGEKKKAFKGLGLKCGLRTQRPQQGTSGLLMFLMMFPGQVTGFGSRGMRLLMFGILWRRGRTQTKS